MFFGNKKVELCHPVCVVRGKYGIKSRGSAAVPSHLPSMTYCDCQSADLDIFSHDNMSLGVFM